VRADRADRSTATIRNAPHMAQRVTSSRAKVNDIFASFCPYGNIGEGQAYAGTEIGCGRRTGECPVVSLAAALSWALSDADGGVSGVATRLRTTPKGVD
jgi:hypothetical protein